MTDDVEPITLQHVDVAMLAPLFNTSSMMSRFCQCLPGGANSSSAHCPLVNDYNITLAELCDGQQQQHLIQVNVAHVLCRTCHRVYSASDYTCSRDPSFPCFPDNAPCIDDSPSQLGLSRFEIILNTNTFSVLWPSESSS